MKLSEIMGIFGITAFSDRELKDEADILRTIEHCKKLGDSMKVDDGYERGVEDVIKLLHKGYCLKYIERLTQGQRQELLAGDGK